MRNVQRVLHTLEAHPFECRATVMKQNHLQVRLERTLHSLTTEVDRGANS